MKDNDAVVRTDNEECAPRSKAHETLKQCIHTLKGPDPGVKVWARQWERKAIMRVRGSMG